MSLINEALKKAQRDRHLENVTAAVGGNARAVARAASGPSKSTLILIGTGLFALFVIAVVGTVLFINRDSSPKSPVIASPAKPTAEPPASSSTPIVAAPIVRPVAPAAETVVPPPIVLSLPSALNKNESAANSGTAPSSNTATAKADTPLAPAVDKFDPRLQLMVDGWKVNLVRVAGAESRLFMNGSSYRIGDVIDRASGLRLTAIADTTVTFTDAEGSTYVKRH